MNQRVQSCLAYLSGPIKAATQPDPRHVSLACPQNMSLHGRVLNVFLVGTVSPPRTSLHTYKPPSCTVPRNGPQAAGNLCPRARKLRPGRSLGEPDEGPNKSTARPSSSNQWDPALFGSVYTAFCTPPTFTSRCKQPSPKKRPRRRCSCSCSGAYTSSAAC